VAFVFYECSKDTSGVWVGLSLVLIARLTIVKRSLNLLTVPTLLGLIYPQYSSPQIMRNGIYCHIDNHLGCHAGERCKLLVPERVKVSKSFGIFRDIQLFA
jgi:hypothetical protein